MDSRSSNYLKIPDRLQGSVDNAWDRFVAASTDVGLPPPRHVEFTRVMRRVWACSSFVAQACIGDPELLDDLSRSGDLFTEYSEGEYARRLDQTLSRVRDEAELGRILRRERRREMVRIAWRDLAGWNGLEQTLRETSWLAEAALDGALHRLDGWLARHWGRPHGHASGRPQWLVVLGMGKLGAHELNFSSDIDLILAYDEEGETRGRRGISNEEYFTRLTRGLAAAIGTTTEADFVFRVDLRLRPYGDSGPLAMSFAQMEEYYQLQGREWERYAMIKARPVAGDRKTGARLLRMLQPFIYRRYLDFGVFDALREMKALIDREAARKELGDDIKLGPGGIREIEFIGQTYQLVRGGREPALRARGILTVLERLGAGEHLPAKTCVELGDAYRFLRRVENRLQMYADRQTHRLPKSEEDRVRLAWSMGFPDWDSFGTRLDHHRDLVRGHFDRVFAGAGSRPASAAVTTFKELWQAGPQATADSSFGAEALRRLYVLRDSYLYRSLSETGRGRMDRLIPLVLEAVAEAGDRDLTLVRVIGVIERIAGRTAYLALLAENPTVLRHMIQLCAASPWIARLLSDQPLLLDELIDPRSLQPHDRAALERDLARRLDAGEATNLEQAMEALRHFKQASVLRVAVADITGSMPLMVVSDHLTDIAEVVLQAVLKLAASGGTLEAARTKGFAIIGYGKLAGFELGYGSDLDIVFLHAAGDGLQPYPRLAQRIVHILGTHTPAGVLYDIDLELRPSGRSGLLVSSIDAFEDYQRQHAWTWEHQALVRARAVAGDTALAGRFGAVRAEVLSRPRDADLLRTEIRDMRDRMRTQLGRGGDGRFDIKQGRGGIVDIEFLVQYAVLRWAHDCRELLRWTDNIRLLETLGRAGLVAADDARLLADCLQMYRARIHRLALQEIHTPVVDEAELAAERAAVTEIWRRLMET